MKVVFDSEASTPIKGIPKTAYLCRECGEDAPCIVLGFLGEADGLLLDGDCEPKFEQVSFMDVVEAVQGFKDGEA